MTDNDLFEGLRAQRQAERKAREQEQTEMEARRQTLADEYRQSLQQRIALFGQYDGSVQRVLKQYLAALELDKEIVPMPVNPEHLKLYQEVKIATKHYLLGIFPYQTIQRVEANMQLVGSWEIPEFLLVRLFYHPMIRRFALYDWEYNDSEFGNYSYYFALKRTSEDDSLNSLVKLLRSRHIN